MTHFSQEPITLSTHNFLHELTGSFAMPAAENPTFGLVVTAKSENEKYTQQLRRSAGVAGFVAAQENKAHWVNVGRAYERFALLGTVLGVPNAHVNTPVELASLRPQFASALGLGAMRPDLAIRFGRGPTMPQSLLCPVQAVLV